MNKKGDWDNRPDDKKLKKFDVVLTNPPFGDDRAYEPKDQKDKEVIQCYELWDAYGGKKIDLGVIFLENAYQILKENGRMGIVLSNSIASIDTHKRTREWLMNKMRIVAIFDLPANVFAETGVNTSIIVAYKPSPKELDKLKDKNYEVFFKDIQKVGYEVKTKKRVKYFEPTYKVDYKTFETEIDQEGRVLLDEDFTKTISKFKNWCNSQEKAVQDLFIKAK
jgi:type I restriction enzyme M protein